VDGDGCPRTYAPFGSALHGLDFLANAGRDGDWFGLACVDGVPVIQNDDDLAPGFYVSTTALCDRTKAETDPRRYVDSSTVPYVSVAGDLVHEGVHLGDLCLVVHNYIECGAIIADISPKHHYGEGSIALAEALGIPSSPKNGGVDDGVEYVIFPASNMGWPVDNAVIQAHAQLLYRNWGGAYKLAAALDGGA
jgi:hypothetical protein